MITWLAVFGAVSAWTFYVVGLCAYARVRRSLDESASRIALCEAACERCKATCDELRTYAVGTRKALERHTKFHPGEDLTRESVRELLRGARLVVDLEDEPTCAAVGAALRNAVDDELGAKTRRVPFCELGLGEEFAWRGEMWAKRSSLCAESTGRDLPTTVAVSADEIVALCEQGDVHAH